MSLDSYVFEGSAMDPPFLPIAFVLVVPNVVVTAAQKAAVKAKKDDTGNSLKW